MKHETYLKNIKYDLLLYSDLLANTAEDIIHSENKIRTGDVYSIMRTVVYSQGTGENVKSLVEHIKRLAEMLSVPKHFVEKYKERKHTASFIFERWKIQNLKEEKK